MPPLLTDEVIDALTPAERRELILRLARPVGHVLPEPPALHRGRHWFVIGLTSGVAVLIPWTTYLAFTLPSRYTARHWDTAWVGFNILLIGMLSITAWLGWKRRQLVVLTAFTTAVLLIVDAWFDVLTAQRGDRPFSVIAAVAVELPVAVALGALSLWIIGAMARRMWVLEPGMRLWHVPLLALVDEESPG